MEPASTMGSGDLGREIDLEELVAALTEASPEIQVNFSNPSMVTLRFDEGGPAITVYRTGSFQTRGTSNREQLYETKEAFLEKLSEIDFEMGGVKFEHKNTVFLGDVGENLQLELVAVQLGLENVEYEPEQFPGVIYRPPEIPAVLLIFGTGKTIITGTTEEAVAKEAMSHLKEITDK